MEEVWRYIFQINKGEVDLLYSEHDKMSCGMGSVFLRKRNVKNDTSSTLEAGEIEKDLGLILTDLTITKSSPMNAFVMTGPIEEAEDGQPKNSEGSPDNSASLQGANFT